MTFNASEKQYEKVPPMLKALANEKRLLIVCSLCNGEKNVGELEAIVGLSQSALSQHLARLRRDGIVDTRRDAQTIYYSIKDPHVPKLLQTISDLFGPPSP
jgi:ArsR family transcriptional regulator, virulence genes transcriptional regulator